MKTRIFIVLMMLSLLTQAQNMGTDTEGFSTIYTQGKSLSLDAVNNRLSFDYYNHSKWDKVKDSVYKSKFYGTSVSGTGENGLANLLSSGEINAGVNINLVYGFNTYKDKSNIDHKKLKKLNIAYCDTEEVIMSIRERVKSSINDLRLNFLSNYLNTHQIKTMFNPADINPIYLIVKNGKDLKSKIDSIKNLKSVLGESVLEKITFFDDKVKGYRMLNKISVGKRIEGNLYVIPFIKNKTLLDNIVTDIGLIKKEFDKSNKIEDEIADLKVKARNIITNKLLFKFGVSGQEFQYDLDNSGETAEERLKDEEFTALSFEVIFNKQFKYYNFLGLSLKGERANNFDALEAKEIAFIEAGTESTETYNAFAGEYDTFNRFSLNADYMRLVPIDSDGDNMYLTINPYLRHFVYSGASQLKSNTNLGLGVNVFNNSKNKLLGGAFIQANDIFNVNTKQALGKKVAIGLVVKFAFEGFDFKGKPNE